ncbi:carbohydrate-binding protein [Deinococcus sp. Arct2-2]|uniref:glycoside hydrolase family 76 protein n=1 Tax=Deinococcus sp. Arct2-2 TaxID=2568653 RepID=UPI0010A42DCF|nr:glycoside hydrolase family 76 protein [Deinococcus sp. Arct2-2]THF71557.1 carbohydrate-binding protein [Deinococcus sp. Arct2-2]
MMRTTFCLTLLLIPATLVSCNTASIVPASTTRLEAQATTANADAAMSAFVNVFWNPTKKYFYTNSDRQIHTHNPGPDGGLYTDYWWEAQLWETVMDAYERTGSTTYRQMIADVYDGFFATYPNWSDNAFNDDIGWWALGSIRAYELTGDVRYRTRAKEMFDFIYTSGAYTSEYGGGIWWNRINFLTQKNVATNATAAIIAMRLKRALNDPSYATKAQNLFAWVRSRLYAGGGLVYDNVSGSGNGTVATWEYTYNFGTFLGAALEMYRETNQVSYLNDAKAAADWAVSRMTLDGTLLYEGEDDTPAFKMIFARNLNTLRVVGNQPQYLSFLQKNATQAWNHRRTSDGVIGPDWTQTPGSGYVQSVAAAAGASILQLTPPDGLTGVVLGAGAYEVENARRNGINNENTQVGYSGRGYLAGWNNDGTSVDIPVNVASAGTYRLDFRYAAGAGNAARQLKVNGGSGNTVSFSGTGSWGSWSTATTNVNLTAGTNVVTLAYTAGAGSSNYLNLDRLNVASTSSFSATLEAENGTLHSLSSESVHAGYTGTGYVAGWNTGGQWVDLPVTVPAAGAYTLTLRYAAAAGNASRYLYINGAGVVNNQSFPATSSWGSYQTVTVSGVNLNSGSNTISVIFDGAKGSSNYLNLDHVVVSR